MIRDLLAFQPVRKGTNLARALAYASKLMRHRGIVVILSDFRATDWEETLRRIARRHDVIAITVDDPRERRLPDAGWIELEDAETGERVLIDSSGPAPRIAMQIAAEELRVSRARALERAHVDHIVLYTDEPYAPTLVKAFAQRTRRFSR